MKLKYLIIGLGNPGKKYFYNRHNIGFLALDVLGNHFHCRVTDKFKQSHMARTELDGHALILLKPQTFMNASGDMARKAAAFFRIPPPQIIVIHDDVDFPLGDRKSVV
jgi:PTH1 family peptidyl-tRNA hydrolase